MGPTSGKIQLENKVCPRCGETVPSRSVEESDLRKLEDETFAFYCYKCDYHWKPTEEEAANIKRILLD